MLLLWDHGTGASHVRGVVEQPKLVGRRNPETVGRTLMARVRPMFGGWSSNPTLSDGVPPKLWYAPSWQSRLAFYP